MSQGDCPFLSFTMTLLIEVIKKVKAYQTTAPSAAGSSILQLLCAPSSPPLPPAFPPALGTGPPPIIIKPCCGPIIPSGADHGLSRASRASAATALSQAPCHHLRISQHAWSTTGTLWPQSARSGVVHWRRSTLWEHACGHYSHTP